MKVRVIAPFEIDGQDAEGDVILPDGLRLRDLLRKYARAPLYARRLPASVNGVVAPQTRRLKDGDLVIFILPGSGG